MRFRDWVWVYMGTKGFVYALGGGWAAGGVGMVAVLSVVILIDCRIPAWTEPRMPGFKVLHLWLYSRVSTRIHDPIGLDIRTDSRHQKAWMIVPIACETLRMLAQE